MAGPFETAKQLNMGVPPYDFGNRHKGHSAQWKSTNMKRSFFWEELLVKLGLKAAP
jgi:hypothetical protein